MVASSRGGRGWASLVVAAATLLLPFAAITWLAWPAPPVPTEVATEIAAVADLDIVEYPESEPLAELDPVSADLAIAVTIPTPALAEPPAAAKPALARAPDRTPIPESWSRESSFNFLVLGVDRRDDGEIPRTDTIIIGSLDLGRPRLGLVSIPRDLLVEIPGYGYDRINAAYVYGEQFESQDGGVDLIRRTIERNFGIPIDHFGLIDFQCFRTAVDALGGLTVDVPRPLLDTRYPTEDFGFKVVRFDSGRQRLNGERALEYARTRHPDNDFGRIRRQQQVIAALRQELLQVRSLPALPAMIAGCRNMRSDLGFFDYLGLANAVRQLGDGDIALRVVDEAMAIETITAGGAAVLLPRWEPIRALVRDTFPRTTLAAGVPAATR